jgi:CheY-like chemotaxis protein
MAYGFVKQSGGTVRLYSELGHGTSVSFYLPVPESLPEKSGEVKKTGAAQGSGPQAGTVLVVDDEADLLEIASMYLTQMGYTALTAMDGPSALELLAQSPDVDLMITDFIMPGGMSGAALAKHVRALRPEIKIIYCSGFPADALAERGSFPVEGPMLRKPYQRDEFQGMVRDALNPGNSSAEVGS